MKETATKLKDKMRSKSLASNKLLILGAVALSLLLVCLLSFGVGVRYGKSHQTMPVAQATNQFGQAFGGPAGRAGRRGIVGQVTAICASNISVSNRRTGSIDTLDITSATQVVNAGQPGSVSDVHVGDNVIVRANSTNQKQADQIMLNPQNMGPGGMSLPPASSNSNTVTN